MSRPRKLVYLHDLDEWTACHLRILLKTSALFMWTDEVLAAEVVITLVDHVEAMRRQFGQNIITIGSHHELCTSIEKGPGFAARFMEALFIVAKRRHGRRQDSLEWNIAQKAAQRDCRRKTA